MKKVRFGGEVSSKQVAERLRAVADRVVRVKWAKRSEMGRQALIGLVRALDALVDDETEALALVSLTKTDEDDDAFIAIVDPMQDHSIGYEMAGRLTNLTQRMASAASSVEQARHDGPSEAHRGHGCAFDPERNEKPADKKKNSKDVN